MKRQQEEAEEEYEPWTQWQEDQSWMAKPPDYQRFANTAAAAVDTEGRSQWVKPWQRSGEFGTASGDTLSRSWTEGRMDEGTVTNKVGSRRAVFQDGSV